MKINRQFCKELPFIISFFLVTIIAGWDVSHTHKTEAYGIISPVLLEDSLPNEDSVEEEDFLKLPEQEEEAPKEVTEEDWAETAKYIIDQFKEEGKEATIEALIISYRESKWNKKALNDNGEKGIDRGVWQINSKWHPDVKDECAFDVVCATKEAKRIWREWKGWTAWVASDRLWLLSRIIK